jgi:outer membrane lipoprotein-sorting protein
MRKWTLIAGLFFLVGVAAAQDKGAKEIVGDVQAKWQTIRDYHCKMQSNNKLGQEKDLKQIEFWFKRNQQVRTEVLDGDKKGSTLTRNDAGRIRGRKGGLLKVVAVTLDENDERIYNLRRRKFYHADWGTVIGEVVSRIKNGWQVERMADETFNNAPCFVVALTGRDRDSRVTKDMLWIEQSSHLILRRKQYEGTDIVNEVLWWEIQLNQDLSDDLFDL